MRSEQRKPSSATLSSAATSPPAAAGLFILIQTLSFVCLSVSASVAVGQAPAVRVYNLTVATRQGLFVSSATIGSHNVSFAPNPQFGHRFNQRLVALLPQFSTAYLGSDFVTLVASDGKTTVLIKGVPSRTQKIARTYPLVLKALGLQAKKNAGFSELSIDPLPEINKKLAAFSERVFGDSHYLPGRIEFATEGPYVGTNGKFSARHGLQRLASSGVQLISPTHLSLYPDDIGNHVFGLVPEPVFEAFRALARLPFEVEERLRGVVPKAAYPSLEKATEFASERAYEKWETLTQAAEDAIAKRSASELASAYLKVARYVVHPRYLVEIRGSNARRRYRKLHGYAPEELGIVDPLQSFWMELSEGVSKAIERDPGITAAQARQVRSELDAMSQIVPWIVTPSPEELNAVANKIIDALDADEERLRREQSGVSPERPHGDDT